MKIYLCRLRIYFISSIQLFHLLACHTIKSDNKASQLSALWAIYPSNYIVQDKS